MPVENHRLYCPLRWLYLSLFLISVSAVTTDPTCSCRDYGSCEFTEFYVSFPNKQNVAVGKTAKISSVYNKIIRVKKSEHKEISGPACLAVNGKIDTTFKPISQFPDSPNCIHTGDDDRQPYWEVDLGQRYSINSITIYWRSSRVNERSAGVKVTVDGQQCHTFQGPVSNPSYITCSTHLAGRTVRLSKYDYTKSEDYFITVCEVEVWVCRPGYFGIQCQHVCPQTVCNNKVVCNPVDGTCPKESYSSDPTEEAKTPTTVDVATTSPASSDITKLVFPLTGSVLAGVVVIGIIIAAVWWVRRSRDRRLGLAAATQGADSMAVGVGDNIAIQCMPAPAVPRSAATRGADSMAVGVGDNIAIHCMPASAVQRSGLREIQTEDYLTPKYDKRAMSSDLPENEGYEKLE